MQERLLAAETSPISEQLNVRLPSALREAGSCRNGRTQDPASARSSRCALLYRGNIHQDLAIIILSQTASSCAGDVRDKIQWQPGAAQLALFLQRLARPPHQRTIAETGIAWDVRDHTVVFWINEPRFDLSIAETNGADHPSQKG